MNHHVSSNIVDVIDALTAAKSAMDTLPGVERELGQTKRELESVYGELDNVSKTADAFKEHIERLEMLLAKREEELRAATFRESETATRLETLRSLVGGALDTVKPAPQPEPEPVDNAKPEASPDYEAVTHADLPAEVPGGATLGKFDEPEPKSPVYLGSTHKPFGMTWGEFKEKGGVAPYWVSDSDA